MMIDQKTMFVTPWRTYAYICIHFILYNVGETFQRSKDHDFNYLNGNFMEDYQDELTIYSKLRK